MHTKLKWILVSSCVIAPTAGVSIWAIQASYKADIDSTQEEPLVTIPKLNSIKLDISILVDELSLENVDDKLNHPEQEKQESPIIPDQISSQPEQTVIFSIEDRREDKTEEKEPDKIEEKQEHESVELEHAKAVQAHSKATEKLQNARQAIASLTVKLEEIQPRIIVSQNEMAVAKRQKIESDEKFRVIEVQLNKQQERLDQLEEWPKVEELQIEILNKAIKEQNILSDCLAKSDQRTCTLWTAAQTDLEQAIKKLANVKIVHIDESNKKVELKIGSINKTAKQLQKDLDLANQQYELSIKNLNSSKQAISILVEPHATAKAAFEKASNDFANLNSSAASELNTLRFYSGSIKHHTEQEALASAEIDTQKTKLKELEEQLKAEAQQ